MKRILFTVMLFCSIAVNAASGQQHYKGVAGVSLSANGLVANGLSYGAEAMYSRYLTRSITLQGGFYWDLSHFKLNDDSYPIHNIGVRADLFYTLLSVRSFYLNGGAGVGVGLEETSQSRSIMEQRKITIDGFQNKFSLSLEPKINAEYFFTSRWALLMEVKGMYRPLSNTTKFIPAFGVGVKTLF